MRNVINHIGLTLTILFAAVVAAHLSSVDAESGSNRPAAEVVRFDEFAAGDTVAAVSEAGEFELNPTSLRGTLLVVEGEWIVIEQGGAHHWIHRNDVISLYRVCE